jgi:hypothetical protein
MAMTDSKSQDAESAGRYSRDEDLKPAKEGEPPRPATDPAGGEKASADAPTNTDPVTGRPKHD